MTEGLESQGSCLHHTVVGAESRLTQDRQGGTLLPSFQLSEGRGRKVFRSRPT